MTEALWRGPVSLLVPTFVSSNENCGQMSSATVSSSGRRKARAVATPCSVTTITVKGRSASETTNVMFSPGNHSRALSLPLTAR